MGAERGEGMPLSLFLLDEGVDDVRLSIIAAIDAPIEKLSVKEICKKAGVSKQTFYSRFTSKYHIANWYAEHCEKRSLNEVGRTLSWEEGLGLLFGAYEAHRSLFFNTSIQTKDLGMETKTRRRRIVVETLERYRKVAITDELIFLIEAYLELEVFLAGAWFKANLSPASKTFTAYYIDCIPKKLYETMQLPETEAVGETVSGNLFSKYYPST